MRNPSELRSQAPASAPRDDRSLVGLVSDLTRDTATLLREELDLAKSELSASTSRAINGLVAFTTSAVVMLAGLVILLAGASYGINPLLPAALTPWIGFLIVGGFFVIVGLILLAKGRRNLKTENLMPDRTVTHLKRDRRLAKEHLT